MKHHETLVLLTIPLKTVRRRVKKQQEGVLRETLGFAEGGMERTEWKTRKRRRLKAKTPN